MTNDSLWVPWLLALVGTSAAVIFWDRWRRKARADKVRYYRFPKGIFVKLKSHYPHLSDKDCQLVASGLRHFFLAYLQGHFKVVTMPSKVADELWHELILYTKDYEKFCSMAFGRFFHHSPAAVLGSAEIQNEGLRRCWHLVCAEENINPKNPTRVPLLFALDAKLNIPDGYRYAMDCSQLGATDKDGQPVHCANEMTGGCTGSCGGGSDSWGDAGGCNGD